MLLPFFLLGHMYLNWHIIEKIPIYDAWAAGNTMQLDSNLEGLLLYVPSLNHVPIRQVYLLKEKTTTKQPHKKRGKNK